VQHSRSISWFTFIGALAAAVHYAVAVGLEGSTALAPGWANVSGFLMAFPVSYVGHRTLSFAGHNAPHQQALPRFLVVACGGFFANQVLLLSLLRWLGQPFWLTLGVVMVMVAFTSYILSRYWAFKSA